MKLLNEKQILSFGLVFYCELTFGDHMSSWVDTQSSCHTPEASFSGQHATVYRFYIYYSREEKSTAPSASLQGQSPSSSQVLAAPSQVRQISFLHTSETFISSSWSIYFHLCLDKVFHFSLYILFLHYILQFSDYNSAFGLLPLAHNWTCTFESCQIDLIAQYEKIHYTKREKDHGGLVGMFLSWKSGCAGRRCRWTVRRTEGRTGNKRVHSRVGKCYGFVFNGGYTVGLTGCVVNGKATWLDKD